MNELRPCPFCGSEFVWRYKTASTDDGFTRCASCNTIARHILWDNRPIEDKLRADFNAQYTRAQRAEEANATLRVDVIQLREALRGCLTVADEYYAFVGLMGSGSIMARARRSRKVRNETNS